jgi:EAL domain-containing protein (putative c-di-GMP-specific phosphodiesterase class I)
LRKLRELSLDVLVVLVTGGSALETAMRAVEYGAYRYLTKPVDIEALASTVRGAAELGQRTRRSRAELATPTPLPTLAPSAEELAQARAFDETLAQLWVGFQPIVDFGGRRLHGYEALVRSDGPFARPNEILGAAEKLGRLTDLGRAIRRRVASQAAAAPEQALLFVNLHARDLADPDLVDRASPLTQVAERVVLEITERTALEEVSDIQARVVQLRGLGFRLALDDLGAGYAGLASFASIEPDVVKLDMSLVRGVDVSPLKQSVIRSVVGLAEELRIQVISEGIELPAERDALVSLGCNLFQGYLFGKPERGFMRPKF